MADTPGLNISNMHIEQNHFAVSIGDQWVDQLGTGFALPTSVGGIRITSLNGSCKNGIDACDSATHGAILHIGIHETVTSIWSDVENAPSNPVDRTVFDESNSNIASPTNNPALIYNLDGAGKVSFTDSNPVDPLQNYGMDCYNGACSFAALAARFLFL